MSSFPEYACTIYLTKLKESKQSEVVLILKLLWDYFTGPAHLGIDCPPCGP